MFKNLQWLFSIEFHGKQYKITKKYTMCILILIYILSALLLLGFPYLLFFYLIY